MRFSFAAIVGALATVANAKAVLSNSAFDVVAGKPFTLNWTNSTGGVTVELVNGPADNLKPVLTIATGVTTSTFTWTPPSTLPSDTYAFRVTDATGEPNFSIRFQFQGSASASVTSSTASSTASSTSSSSSASTTTSSSSSVTSASNTTTSTSKTSSSTTTSATRAATTTPANNNSGDRFSSSLALVLVTVAALICFN